jgi:pimeloyl-ACP methyl ester carboxylesterase
MTTYVLVHGAAHGGWCYGPVARRLRAAGHEVHAPTLTGVGERRHLARADTDLDTHVTDIVNVLVYEDLHDIVLVGHSYGGMVVTGVADRALDRVAHLVYLDAAQPRHGESLADTTPVVHALPEHTGVVVDGVQMILNPASGQTYGVTDPVVGAWMLERLTPHPWKTFVQPLVLRHEAEVLRIPRTSITCPDTLVREPKEIWERTFEADNVWHIDAGHDLMLAAPDQVAELLLRLADEENP